MSFIASSSKWGDQAAARLCEIVISSNDGMAQQIMENRTDLLDILSKEDLERTDDLGLSLPYLAIYYDRPDMVAYLHKRGLDLSKPCDSLGYGNPMFYAVDLARHGIVRLLYRLNYSLRGPCETFFNLAPHYYATVKNDALLVEWIAKTNLSEINAIEFLRKNILRNRLSKLFRRKRAAAIQIERIARGRLARRYVRALRAGDSIMLKLFAKESFADEALLGPGSPAIMGGSVYSTDQDDGTEQSSIVYEDP